MKRITIFALSLLFLASCKKETVEPQQTTVDNIYGKWMVVQRTEDEYKPIATLISREVYNGNGGDSMIFKPNNKLHVYSDIDGHTVIDFQVINNNILRIESEDWQIANLTGTELKLLSDEVDHARNERSVVNVTLRRP